MRLASAVAALLVLGLASSTLAPSLLVAQAPRSDLSVHVLDAADRPVPNASVELVAARRRHAGTTDATGTVRLPDLPRAEWQLVVMRIGYARVSTRVETVNADERITVFLEERATALATVDVEAPRPVVGRLADFESRLRTREANAVVTRADIEKRNPIALSQMLRGIAGIRVADSLGVRIAVSTRGSKFSRSGGGQGMVPCVMRTMLDGIVLPPLTDIDEIVPRDVHGIEVFNGPARIPPKLANMRADGWCGLIAVWTRAGEDGM